MNNVLQDVRFALRVLLKSPGFTFVALLTLALGIGSTTSIFSVINGVLLKPLPYEQPGQIVKVWEKTDGGGAAWVAGGVFLDWKEHSALFEHLCIIAAGEFKNLTGEGEPERLHGWEVSADFLEMLRVRPILGRGFLPDEDKPGGNNNVVLLTHALWQRRFGGDTNIIGRVVRFNMDPYTVIGVLPPKALVMPSPFSPPDVQFLAPAVLGKEWQERSHAHFNAMGRLKPGVTAAEAQRELLAIKQQLQSEYPKAKEKWGSLVVPLHQEIAGPVQPTLLLLLGAAGCVLLIACSNVANLLLAKAVSRQKEMALRAALGASRWRVVRQTLVESLMLSLPAGVLGAVLAYSGVRILSTLQEGTLPLTREVHVDLVVLGFSIAMSVGTGILVGFIPAWHASAQDVNQMLKESARSSDGVSRNRVRSVLVVSQVALALMLLAGTGLLLKSLSLLLRVPIGFNAERALGMDLSASKAKYPEGEQRARFLHQIIHRLEALPGVEAAGAVTILPMTGGSLGTSLTVEGRANQPELGYGSAFDIVGGNYFRALGIPILRGRALAKSDDATNAPPVCVINDALAGLLFPEEDPLGKRLRQWGKAWEVVGIVGGVRHYSMESKADPRVYLPQPSGQLFWNLIVRTKRQPLALVEAVRKEILAVDPDQPVSNVRTMEQAISRSVAGRRFKLTLLSLFGCVALFLAAIGLYGVMAYAVTQRTHEIGIRMALGARRVDVLTLVMKHGMALSLLGAALGVIGALLLAPVIKRQLYEVSETDPMVLAGVSLFLVVIALFGCWLPSRRATKIEPMEALRYE